MYLTVDVSVTLGCKYGGPCLRRVHGRGNVNIIALECSALPMYCVVFSFKDSFDTKDMHSDAGADARYDIDFPARDHTVVAQLRNKGAIIYAKSLTSEYNGLGGDPGGKNFETKHLNLEMYSRSTWAGNPSSRL